MKKHYLPYPIENQNGDKEVAIINTFADNTIYKSIADLTVKGKTIKRGDVYSGVKLKSLLPKVDYSKSFKITKLENVFKLDFQLDELDDISNIADGSLRKSLIIHHVFAEFDVTQFKPGYPQYKKLRNGVFRSLKIKVTDENCILMKNKIECIHCLAHTIKYVKWNSERL